MDKLLSSLCSLANYYPFGMMQPGRQWAADSSLFGFQGQMKDDEVAGRGNFLNFDFRGYDSRTGRFWSLDPLMRKFPFQSGYVFSEDRVVDAIELEGLEAYKTTENTKNGTTKLKINFNFGIKNSCENEEVKIPKDFGNHFAALLNYYSSVFPPANDQDNNVQYGFGQWNYQSKNTEFYFDLVDFITDGDGKRLDAGGHTHYFGNPNHNQLDMQTIQEFVNSIETDYHDLTKDKRSFGKQIKFPFLIETAMHEAAGHALGLRHENDNENPIEIEIQDDENNLMQHNGSKDHKPDLLLDQWKIMNKTIDDHNNSNQSEENNNENKDIKGK